MFIWIEWFRTSKKKITSLIFLKTQKLRSKEKMKNHTNCIKNHMTRKKAHLPSKKKDKPICLKVTMLAQNLAM